ncbi:hypothetical protein OVA24_15260 [Luteolibacter sp. SL250]|uniref:type II secretion system protein n=1 Tax=Luteolibacter sp. SL250 TaxID=2995170 RepID=UPI00226F9019|nr:hypothetical protein [Luteolibacter sp. SL250]WAC18589.1 hypothetical protein OVA24_15260 [Luteolibacter sp. SL250]
MMEIQPPPDVPAPPPSDDALRSRRLFRRIIAYGIISLVVLIIVGLVPSWWGKSRRPHELYRTLGNAKQLGLALMEFEKDYGKYPGADTIAEVRQRTGTSLSLGTSSSNHYLRQLLAADILDEGAFYSRGTSTKRPDRRIDVSGALEKGECGFAYVPGLDFSSPPGTPVLIAGLIHGTDRVNPAVPDGVAVLVCVDGTVKEGITDKHGHLIIGGKRLLDPANPIWKGLPPSLAWPE